MNTNNNNQRDNPKNLPKGTKHATKNNSTNANKLSMPMTTGRSVMMLDDDNLYNVTNPSELLNFINSPYIEENEKETNLLVLKENYTKLKMINRKSATKQDNNKVNDENTNVSNILIIILPTTDFN